MKSKIHIAVIVLITVVTISVVAYAGGPGGGSGGSSMMGGGGQGMMGGHGSGTVGLGQTVLNLIEKLAGKWNESSIKTSAEKERLRGQINEKRLELADLYQSENPDRKLIDKKIHELNRLESDFDG